MNVILIILIIALAGALALMAFRYHRSRRSGDLRQRFGPEYDRALGEYGDPRKAEPVLLDRQKRVEKLNIVPLPEPDRERFADEWRQVQARFVDDPVGATREADWLVEQVMEARGYPMGNFEQRAADISVDHGNVVENYRAAHDVALLAKRGQAETEDLRKALVHYRALFEDLLERRVIEEPQQAEARQ